MRTDRIVSVSAIMISLMTLVVLVFQTRMIREQQRNSVYPHLMISNQGRGTANYKMKLSNEGVGPAFIEEIKITYKDSVYRQDIPSFLYENFPAMDTIDNVLHSNIWEGKLLPADDEVYIFDVQNSEEDALALITLLQSLEEEDFKFEMTYRSIYKERWLLSSEHNEPINISK